LKLGTSDIDLRVDYAPTSQGGAEHQARLQAEAFARRGTT